MEQVGILNFQMLDPARTAGGDDRKRLIRFESAEKFVRFFHYRQIGSEIRVENAIETDGFQRSRHLFADIGAGRKVKGFAERNPRGRRGLDHDRFRRIVQEVFESVQRGALKKRARRADLYALPAGDAFRRIGNPQFEIAVGGRNGADSLYGVANRDASVTAYAFRRIAEETAHVRVAVFIGRLSWIWEFPYAEFFRQILQAAVAVFRTNHTIVGVIRQEQRDRRFPRGDDFRRIGEDFHSFGDFGGTGGIEFVFSLNFHKTHPTGRRKMLEMQFRSGQGAKRRNPNPAFPRGFQYRDRGIFPIFCSVDFEFHSPILRSI